MTSNAGRRNLGVQGFGPDVEWYKNAHDVFNYKRSIITSVPYVTETFDIPTYSTGSTLAYGQTLGFELDKRGDLLGGIEIIIDRGALSAATGSPNFSDWEVYSAIDTVRFKYANDYFWETTGDALYVEMQQEKPRNVRLAAGILQNGIAGTGNPNYTSGAETGGSGITLTTTSQRAQQVVASLLVPWENINSRIPILAMPNKIVVEVTLKALSHCTSNAGAVATACTINNVYLRCQYTHLLQKHKQKIFDEINARDSPVYVKTLTTEAHYDVQYTGTNTTLTIPIKNIKNSVATFDILIRHSSDIGVTASFSADVFDFLNAGGIVPLQVYLQDNGTRVTDIVNWKAAAANTPQQYSKCKQMELYPNGNPLLNVLSLSFADPYLIEHSGKEAVGSRLIQAYNNPELIITFNVAPGAAQWYVDVHGWIHNYIIYKKGVITKYIK